MSRQYGNSKTVFAASRGKCHDGMIKHNTLDNTHANDKTTVQESFYRNQMKIPWWYENNTMTFAATRWKHNDKYSNLCGNHMKTLWQCDNTIAILVTTRLKYQTNRWKQDGMTTVQQLVSRPDENVMMAWQEVTVIFVDARWKWHEGTTTVKQSL